MPVTVTTSQDGPPVCSVCGPLDEDVSVTAHVLEHDDDTEG